MGPAVRAAAGAELVAVAARDMWGQVRDAQLSVLRPEWAVWDDELVPSKSAPPWYDDVNPWTPDYPDLPWRYEYKLPELCLVPLALWVSYASILNFSLWRLNG